MLSGTVKMDRASGFDPKTHVSGGLKLAFLSLFEGFDQKSKGIPLV